MKQLHVVEIALCLREVLHELRVALRGGVEHEGVGLEAAMHVGAQRDTVRTGVDAYAAMVVLYGVKRHLVCLEPGCLRFGHEVSAAVDCSRKPAE